MILLIKSAKTVHNQYIDQGCIHKWRHYERIQKEGGSGGGGGWGRQEEWEGRKRMVFFLERGCVLPAQGDSGRQCVGYRGKTTVIIELSEFLY